MGAQGYKTDLGEQVEWIVKENERKIESLEKENSRELKNKLEFRRDQMEFTKKIIEKNKCGAKDLRILREEKEHIIRIQEQIDVILKSKEKEIRDHKEDKEG